MTARILADAKPLALGAIADRVKCWLSSQLRLQISRSQKNAQLGRVLSSKQLPAHGKLLDKAQLTHTVESRKMSSDNSEFQKILERVCAGSEDAIWELIETYGPHIQRVVRRRLNHKMRSKFDSLDFVQMVWASFFTEREKLVNFKEPSELSRYLAILAQRKLIQESRRRLQGVKHNVDLECQLAGEAEEESAYTRKSNTPSQIVMAKDELECMMANRSDRDRQVVELRMQGLKFVEIAEKLGIHERTAREVIGKLAVADSA